MSLVWGEQPPPEPRLRRLTLDDAPRAADLARAVGWPHDAATWERLITWGGRGCFCLAQGRTAQEERLLATAIGIGYGRERAWLGMVLTHPDHRRRGYAAQTTQAVLEFLRERGVARILLNATGEGRPLYEKLGFRALDHVEVWTGRASSYLGPRARPLRESDLPGVIALDADVFGVARGRVIQRLARDFPHLGWVDEDSGEIAGFLLAQGQLDAPREEGLVHLGPWTHRSPWGAEKLLKTALSVLIGRQVRLDIPDQNAAALALVRRHDLRYARHCARMIYGDVPPPSEIIAWQYGIASMATG